MNLLATRRRRRLLFGALYLSEGAPIGYLWWALPTRLRDAGVPIEEVTTFTALLTIPWTFKFLWAPLVDAFPSQRFGVRPWILGSQLLMGLTLLPVLQLDLAADREWLLWILVVHALCAATQDVSIDALAVKTIPATERGDITGTMQVGMLIGRSVFGGAVLAFEEIVGSSVVLLALIAAIWSSAVLAALAEDRAPAAQKTTAPLRLFARNLSDVLRQRTTWLGFTFAALAGCAMEATGGLAGPMMIDRGFDRDQVGWFFALPAVICMASGALVGGRLADRYRRDRAVAISLVTLAICVCLVAAAIQSGAHSVIVASLALSYLLFGTLTAAIYALLMDLTEPRLGATQFSTYMGAINLCYVWSAWAGGQLAGRLDYPLALITMALASLSALLLLPPLHHRLTDPLEHA